MEPYSIHATERAMKMQEVILRAMSGQMHWFHAAEIVGVSERTMRRASGSSSGMRPEKSAKG